MQFMGGIKIVHPTVRSSPAFGHARALRSVRVVTIVRTAGVKTSDDCYARISPSPGETM